MQIKKLAFSPSWILGDKQKQSSYCYSVSFGSPNWARTSDIMINSHALYRLSYGGI